MDDVSLVGPEGPQCADVRGGFGQDDVAWVDEDLGDEVEGLLRTGGDGDVVGMAAYAVGPHDLGDHLPQFGVALPRAVLEDRRSSVAQKTCAHLREELERQPLDIGHPSGQGDDFRSIGDGEKRTHLRLAHSQSAIRIRVVPRIQARTGRSGTGRAGRASLLFAHRALLHSCIRFRWDGAGCASHWTARGSGHTQVCHASAPVMGACWEEDELGGLRLGNSGASARMTPNHEDSVHRTDYGSPFTGRLLTGQEL